MGLKSLSTKAGLGLAFLIAASSLHEKAEPKDFASSSKLSDEQNVEFKKLLQKMDVQHKEWDALAGPSQPTKCYACDV